MTWVFSHCEQDHFPDGCAGCPALPDRNGKPRADNCAAVFVEVKPKACASWEADWDWRSWLFGYAGIGQGVTVIHVGPLCLLRVRA